MTYNVFGGMLNLAQFNSVLSVVKPCVMRAAGAAVQVHPGRRLLIPGEGMVDDIGRGAGLGSASACA